MNQEQFRQFWEQLKAPLIAKWAGISNEDLSEIKGDLSTFCAVIQKRYGDLRKDEVVLWANRRYCHWSGNYLGYTEEIAAA